jgi:hypothetical protein
MTHSSSARRANPFRAPCGVDPVDCLHPSFADRRPDGFKVDQPSPFPVARGRGSASGRRPAFRATSTTGSPQGGNQR